MLGQVTFQTDATNLEAVWSRAVGKMFSPEPIVVAMADLDTDTLSTF